MFKMFHFKNASMLGIVSQAVNSATQEMELRRMASQCKFWQKFSKTPSQHTS
jgi:hypothetical protein